MGLFDFFFGEAEDEFKKEYNKTKHLYSDIYEYHSSFIISEQDEETGEWIRLESYSDFDSKSKQGTSRTFAVKRAKELYVEGNSIRVRQDGGSNAHCNYNRIVWKNGGWLI